MAESEFILLRRFTLNGDAEAFSEIVKKHAPLVYGVCLRILGNKDNAADVVQDTFLQLVHDAAEITGSLPNWLHRVATCRAIDLVRNDSQRKKREFNYAASSENINSEEEKAAWSEISVCIDEELESLDDQTKEVLILRFFENLTTNDIAEKCGISQPTVYRWIESGIELLRLKLKSRGVIVPAAVFTALLSENIVKAAPASIMKELGKIALAGSKATIAAKIASSISAGIAVKTKIMAGILIVLLGAGLTIVFSFIANGENKSNSTWELIQQSLKKQPEQNKKTNETRSETKIANIKANELLAKYKQALESTQSFISKSETTTTFDTNFGNNAPAPSLRGRKQKGGDFQISEIRYDGERTYIRTYRWTEPNPPKESRIRDKANDFKLNNFADGENYRHSMTINTEGLGGFVMVNKTEFYQPDNETIMLGSYLFGTERVDKVLEKTTNISVRPATEKIGDSDCYVLDAKIKYGKLSIWIDPDHGYQHAKVELLATEGDFMTNSSKATKGQSNSRVINFGQFEQVDGIWIPMEFKSTDKLILGPDGYNSGEVHFKRTEFVLNPDHDALGSFDSPLRNPKNDPELINGTPVQIAYLNKRFEWQDGKLLDKNGEVFDLDKIKPVSLLGKALPKLSEFNVRLEPDVIKDKMMLLCFWDMDQRPSRNAVLSLNKQANSLLEKGLYMVFIHAGAIEEGTFTSWLKRNEIVPPVGVSNNGLPGLGYTWGVKSLPWLILTDKNHIVTSEGFGIADLNEKIDNN